MVLCPYVGYVGYVGLFHIYRKNNNKHMYIYKGVRTDP